MLHNPATIKQQQQQPPTNDYTLCVCVSVCLCVSVCACLSVCEEQKCRCCMWLVPLVRIADHHPAADLLQRTTASLHTGTEICRCNVSRHTEQSKEKSGEEGDRDRQRGTHTHTHTWTRIIHTTDLSWKLRRKWTAAPAPRQTPGP